MEVLSPTTSGEYFNFASQYFGIIFTLELTGISAERGFDECGTD